MSSGFVAALTFLITTGIGYFAQVLKLIRRFRKYRAGELTKLEVCQGLHPTREILSFTAFLLFALSGLTRSYLDLFIFGSRMPVIVLSILIIYYLFACGYSRAKFYFFYACLSFFGLSILAVLIATGVRFDQTLFAAGVDATLSAVGFLLFYGKLLQGWHILKLKSAGAVSVFREVGILIKDLSGLWYAFSIGIELFWIGFTHILSAVASFLIIVAVLHVRKHIPKPLTISPN